jgi:uncharacterized surface protein with fasciclin (FAS1) repeats
MEQNLYIAVALYSFFAVRTAIYWKTKQHCSARPQARSGLGVNIMKILKLGVKSLSPMFVALSITVFSAGSLMADDHQLPPVPVPDEQRQDLPTVYEAALAFADEGQFTTLVNLLVTAFGLETLEDLFDGDAHYTVFAPTNDAFDALLGSLTEAQAEALLDVDNGLLASILLYHVARGDWYAADFPVGSLRMADGNVASIHWEGEMVKMEGVRVHAETLVQNGIAHVLDGVIVPPGFLDALDEAASP